MTAAIVQISEHLCECGCGEYTPLATRSDARRKQIKGQPIRFLAGHFLPGNRKTKLALDREPEEITPEWIREMRGWDDQDAAEALDRRLRELERRYKRSFIELGLILQEMEDRQLWPKVVNPETGEIFTSFSAWVMNAAPFSKTTAYAARKAVRELKDFPAAELADVPRCNVETLVKLSTQVRKSTVKVTKGDKVIEMPVIEAAKMLTEGEFSDVIEEQKPEQHIERRRAVVAKQTKSQKKGLDEALLAAGAIYEIDTREGQLEQLAAFFMQSDCEIEKYDGLSNREAYQNIQDNSRGYHGRSKKK